MFTCYTSNAFSSFYHRSACKPRDLRAKTVANHVETTHSYFESSVKKMNHLAHLCAHEPCVAGCHVVKVEKRGTLPPVHHNNVHVLLY